MDSRVVNFSETPPEMNMNGSMKQPVSNDYKSKYTDFTGEFCNMPPKI